MKGMKDEYRIPRRPDDDTINRNEGSKYVNGVEGLLNPHFDNFTEKEKLEYQEYAYWLAEKEIREQDERYQQENR
jgi:hypothetical protein